MTNLRDEHFIIKAKPLYPAIQGVIKNFKTKSNILYLKQHLVDDIENQFNISDPSTGFVAIMMALQWCENVSIFGFGFFEEDWSNQHYFENIKPYVRGHNPMNEKNYIEQLIKSKHLKMY